MDRGVAEDADQFCDTAGRTATGDHSPSRHTDAARRYRVRAILTHNRRETIAPRSGVTAPMTITSVRETTGHRARIGTRPASKHDAGF